MFNSINNYLFKNSPEYYCYSNYDLLYQSNFNPIKHAIDLSLISVISNQNFTDNYSQNVSKTFSFIVLYYYCFYSNLKNKIR